MRRRRAGIHQPSGPAQSERHESTPAQVGSAEQPWCALGERAVERDHLPGLLLRQLDAPLLLADAEGGERLVHGEEVTAQQDAGVGRLVDDVRELRPPAADLGQHRPADEHRRRLAEDVRTGHDGAADRGPAPVVARYPRHPTAAEDGRPASVDEVTPGAHQGDVRVGVHGVDLVAQAGRVDHVVAADQLDELTGGRVGHRLPVRGSTASRGCLPHPYARDTDVALQRLPGAVA